MLDMSSINDPGTCVALSSYKPVVEKSNRKSKGRGLMDLNVECQFHTHLHLVDTLSQETEIAIYAFINP